MTRPSGKSIIVTVGDEALAKIHELAAELSAKGMSVDQVMPVMGVISGSAEPKKLAQLRKIKGVMGVEEEVNAELPGPDEPQ
jgi:hypothetical protein